jgi:hypothetical protein
MINRLEDQRAVAFPAVGIALLVRGNSLPPVLVFSSKVRVAGRWAWA